MPNVKVKIEGMERLREALSDPRIIKGPVRRFLEKAGRTVEARAALKAPRDEGRLSGSITTKVEGTRAVVGPGVKYAPFVEFGTRPHWPPLKAMQPWARRHGFPAGRAGAFLVARAIAERGTRAQPFLLPALEESVGDIEGFLREMAREVEEEWGRRG